MTTRRTDNQHEARVCEYSACGQEFVPVRTDQKYCDSSCRKADFEDRHKNGIPLEVTRLVSLKCGGQSLTLLAPKGVKIKAHKGSIVRLVE